jgi:tRNA threonylcarbamoyladenosine biosynthesis protein TsaB
VLILAVDTSGRSGGVALVRGDAQSFEVVASAPLAGGTYSAQLVPQIAALLEQQKLGLDQLDGFAVAAGPGSFTGLRVGLATVKGLAEVARKPIAAVSVLEAVAAAVQHDGAEVTIAALDAGRGEVYVAEYRVHPSGRELARELIAQHAEFVAEIRGEAKGAVGPIATPDESVAALAAAAGLRLLRVPMPGVADIARLGLAKLLAREVVSVGELDANYIRRSDAEIFSTPAKAKDTAEAPRHGEKRD